MSKEILNNSFQNKIINFIKMKQKNLIVLLVLLIFTLFGYFFYENLKKKNEIQISAQFTKASIQFKLKEINYAKQLLLDIVNKKHKFYSPLALYFIIDNNLEKDPEKVITFFDKILSINSIDKENLNLIKIKKAIFLFSLGDEELIINTLNPIINSNSVWRKLAIKLISDYFFFKNQEIKANEYIQLLNKKIKK
jgi:predicted negative regulator of RcsB-dependent stress response